MKNLLFVALIVFLAGCTVCPPQGLWPMPPWCNENAIIEESPQGSVVSVFFEVSLPSTNDDVFLHFNNSEYLMNKLSDYYFVSGEFNLVSGESIDYYYSSDSKRTSDVNVIVSDNNISKGLIWNDAVLYNIPGFIKGHTVMDAGGMIIRPLRGGELESTVDSMKDSGAEWYSYDYYWAYTDANNTQIVDETTMGLEGRGDTPATQEDIRNMANLVQGKGLKFLLLTELEWQVYSDEAAGLSWNEFFELLNDRWSQGQSADQYMGNELTLNPNDPFVNAYWDNWFIEFENFMITVARTAEDNNIEVLTLGKSLEGAMHPENSERWHSLISKVREVYSGELTQAVWINEWGPLINKDSFDWSVNYPTLYGMDWLGDLDFITVYYWHKLSDEKNPEIAELVSEFEKFNDEHFDVLHEEYGVPLVFLVSFQSRDYAAKQQWFEPLSSHDDVGLDFMAQADLYEAFFQATVDEPWFKGLMTWGYWIEEDFNPQYSFHKSSSVRNKPAELVVEKWFSMIE